MTHQRSSTQKKTRGLQHLIDYLGDDKSTALPKTARDVVPVLQESAAAAANRAGMSGIHPPLAPAVLQYVEQCLASGATRSLTQKQLKLVRLLSWERHHTTEDSAALAVKRVPFSTVEHIRHLIGVAALQRWATTATQALAGDERSLFVLVQSNSEAEALGKWLKEHYQLDVVVASSSETNAYPPLPSALQKGGPAAVGASKNKGKKGSKKAAKKQPEEADEEGQQEDIPLASVPVFIASPEGFLAWNARSAVWRCIGAMAVVLSTPKVALELGESGSIAALSSHRWSTLGHTSLTCVLSTHEEVLSDPTLEWLTSIRPSSSTTSSSNGAVVPLTRKKVEVKWHVADGMERVQFLYGLIQGLQQGRGMLVHVATKEMCVFLFDVLYRFLDALPPHLFLMTDYEGESSYSPAKTQEDRQQLLTSFDSMVNDGKRSPVLISCFGLIPARGSIFVQYDIITDLPNFSQFIAEKLTPGAGSELHSSSVGNEVEVVRRVVSRKRSRSRSPPPPTGGASAGAPPAASSSVSAPAANYSFLFILLRSNEQKPATALLSRTGTRLNISYARLTPAPPLLRFLFIAEKIRSMNKKLFHIQNAAYHAYKATMTVYCTIGPREVYNEKTLNLQKAVQEFGYEDIPLLDLRLKDTPFRPREDFIKASRIKQSKERRAYNAFAQQHIQGEGPTSLEDL